VSLHWRRHLRIHSWNRHTLQEFVNSHSPLLPFDRHSAVNHPAGMRPTTGLGGWVLFDNHFLKQPQGAECSIKGVVFVA
jgi:hypothetical protein